MSSFLRCVHTYLVWLCWVLAVPVVRPQQCDSGDSTHDTRHWHTEQVPAHLPSCMAVLAAASRDGTRPFAVHVSADGWRTPGAWQRALLLRDHGNMTVSSGSADAIAAFDGHPGPVRSSLRAWAWRGSLMPP